MSARPELQHSQHSQHSQHYDAKDPFLLQRCVFLDDATELSFQLRESYCHVHPRINEPDHRGNTPLMLAVKLGRKDLVSRLLNAGASALVKTDGWTPYQEATSYGDREMMKLLFMRRIDELDGHMKTKTRNIGKKLNREIPDMELEMHWKFHSWVPLLSRVCPSDTYRITKKGRSVRVDFSLIGFKKLRWQRANVSLIYEHLDKTKGSRLALVDWDKKIVQILETKTPDDKKRKEKEKPLTEEEMDALIDQDLSNPILSTPMLSVPPSLTRAKTSRFLGFGQQDRNEVIEGWPTTVWNVENVVLRSFQRTEHLEARPSSWKKSKRDSRNSQDAKSSKEEKSDVDTNSTKSKEEDVDWDGVMALSEEEIAKRWEDAEARNYKFDDEGMDQLDSKAFESASEESEDEFHEAFEGPEDNDIKAPWATNVHHETSPSRPVRKSDDNQSAVTGSIQTSPSLHLSTIPGPPPPFSHRPKSPKPYVRSPSGHWKPNEEYKRQSISRHSIGSSYSTHVKPVYISSLPPPPQTVTYDEYFAPSSVELQHPLGRRPTIAPSITKGLKATLWLTPSFPMTLGTLTPLLDLLDFSPSITPHLHALRTFLSQVSCEGFPVQIELPILPILKAQITFGKCTPKEVDDTWFDIPEIGHDGWKEGFVIKALDKTDDV